MKSHIVGFFLSLKQTYEREDSTRDTGDGLNERQPIHGREYKKRAGPSQDRLSAPVPISDNVLSQM
jgi:hypothetical protein